nr:immunoglobulin light chain junction region [Macaca mulatta]
CQQYADLLPTF